MNGGLTRHVQVGSRATSFIPEEPESSDDEVRALPSKPRSRSHARGDKPTSRSKTKERGTNIADPGEIIERPTRHGEGGIHQNEDGNKQTEGGDVEEGEVVGDEVPPTTKRRDRRREQGSDVEEAPPPVKSRKPPNKLGKARETDAEGEEKEELHKKRAKSKPASSTGGQKQSEADTEEDQPAKKKKRKLNVTGGSSVFGGPAGFTWTQVWKCLSSIWQPFADGSRQDDGENLGIPSVLSPVKEGEPVPARSTSATLLGGWKMW